LPIHLPAHRASEENRTATDSVVAVDFRPGADERGFELPRVAVWVATTRAPRVQRVARVRCERRRRARRPRGRDPDVGARGGRGRPTPSAPGCTRWARQRASPSRAGRRERWQSVRRAEDLPRARREVLAGAARVGDGVIARHLNRPISLRHHRALDRVAGETVAGERHDIRDDARRGLSFAIGHATTGGLLAQCASVLDGVDGELARVRYQDSAFGGLYDALLDRVGEAAVIGGMTLYRVADGGRSLASRSDSRRWRATACRWS
jgi:hypothetical protein